MSNMAWSEQELANAAKRVAESMLTSFPSPRTQTGPCGDTSARTRLTLRDAGNLHKGGTAS